MKKTEIVSPNAASLTLRALPSKVFQAYRFAPEWFDDLLGEARRDGHSARRREIVFAVCFVESYLFEWVRDEVLKRNYDELLDYFPSTDRCSGKKIRPIKDRLRKVPAKLAKQKRIPKDPKLSGGKGEVDPRAESWDDFKTLLDYRNGLIHASSSRPESSGQAKGEAPHPSKGILDNLQPGWALNTACQLIADLHSRSDTSVSPWLKDRSEFAEYL